jgi:hypothetical protein
MTRANVRWVEQRSARVPARQLAGRLVAGTVLV